MFTVHPDGTITTDDIDQAITLARKIATLTASSHGGFLLSTPERGIVRVESAAPPPAKTDADPKALPTALSRTEAVAATIEHAMTMPDAFAILRALQEAGGREVTREALMAAIKLNDGAKLAGKLAGLVKTAKRVGLDADEVFVRSQAGYGAAKRLAYRAGKGLLGAPPLGALKRGGAIV